MKTFSWISTVAYKLGGLLCGLIDLCESMWDVGCGVFLLSGLNDPWTSDLEVVRPSTREQGVGWGPGYLLHMSLSAGLVPSVIPVWALAWPGFVIHRLVLTSQVSWLSAFFSCFLICHHFNSTCSEHVLCLTVSDKFKLLTSKATAIQFSVHNNRLVPPCRVYEWFSLNKAFIQILNSKSRKLYIYGKAFLLHVILILQLLPIG